MAFKRLSFIAWIRRLPESLGHSADSSGASVEKELVENRCQARYARSKAVMKELN